VYITVTAAVSFCVSGQFLVLLTKGLVKETGLWISLDKFIWLACTTTCTLNVSKTNYYLLFDVSTSSRGQRKLVLVLQVLDTTRTSRVKTTSRESG